MDSRLRTEPQPGHPGTLELGPPRCPSPPCVMSELKVLGDALFSRTPVLPWGFHSPRSDPYRIEQEPGVQTPGEKWSFSNSNVTGQRLRQGHHLALILASNTSFVPSSYLCASVSSSAKWSNNNTHP